jgi:hypothetical protein
VGEGETEERLGEGKDGAFAGASFADGQEAVIVQSVVSPFLASQVSLINDGVDMESDKRIVDYLDYSPIHALSVVVPLLCVLLDDRHLCERIRHVVHRELEQRLLLRCSRRSRRRL